MPLFFRENICAICWVFHLSPTFLSVESHNYETWKLICNMQCVVAQSIYQKTLKEISFSYLDCLRLEAVPLNVQFSFSDFSPRLWSMVEVWLGVLTWTIVCIITMWDSDLLIVLWLTEITSLTICVNQDDRFITHDRKSAKCLVSNGAWTVGWSLYKDTSTFGP